MYENIVYHKPWYNYARGIWSNVHFFAGAVDILWGDDHTVACQASVWSPPCNREERRSNLRDHHVGRRRDY